jgi:hypothetical protein
MTFTFYNKSLLLILFLLAITSHPLISQTFTGSFDLVAVQNYPNGNERKDTLSYYFGEIQTAIVIYGKRNQPDMRLVFNSQKETITGLFEMNGEKGGYILPMDETHWPGLHYAKIPYGAGPRSVMNYTGSEKVIEGYKCKEVLAENEEYTASLWLANEIPMSMSRVLSYQSVGKGKSRKELELFDQFGIEGLPLIMELKSKMKKADVTIFLVNIKTRFDPEVFSSEGHSLRNIE